ncbi:MAG: DsbA family protein [Neisseriaceae bacterium]|nr:DsbA family protein [Neisseriaceae bacterium]
MSQATLHYIFDPFCGWCYAAAPLVDAATTLPGLTVALHGGGMLAGAQRRQIDTEWRGYVMPHDERIAQLSGQPFGEAYFEGLLRDLSYVMDSAQPIAAILAADALNGQGLAMLHRLQIAHYQEGQRISDTPVLSQLAAELGHDQAAFAQALSDAQGATTEAHINAARNLLRQVGGQGFPTLALAHSNGQWQVLPSSQYLGQVDDWLAFLRQQLGA